MNKHWLNIISLIISISALGFSLFKLAPFEVGFETYIGIIASFIGISVALLIGYQVVNAIELNKRIGKIEELASSINQQKILNEQNLHRSEGNIMFVQGQFFLLQAQQLQLPQTDKNQFYIKSFITFHSALFEFLISDLKKTDLVFENFQSCIDGLSEGASLSKASIKDLEYNLFSISVGDIRKSQNYSVITNRYERVLSDFFTKVGGK